MEVIQLIDMEQDVSKLHQLLQEVYGVRLRDVGSEAVKNYRSNIQRDIVVYKDDESCVYQLDDSYLQICEEYAKILEEKSMTELWKHHEDVRYKIGTLLHSLERWEGDEDIGSSNIFLLRCDNLLKEIEEHLNLVYFLHVVIETRQGNLVASKKQVLIPNELGWKRITRTYKSIFESAYEYLVENHFKDWLYPVLECEISIWDKLSELFLDSEKEIFSKVYNDCILRTIPYHEKEHLDYMLHAYIDVCMSVVEEERNESDQVDD